MHKLSIITINLNNASGLRKTIDSVVAQSFTDIEYIIIDGGSNDGSIEVIKEHTEEITYWISEPDKGIYNAMNKGILKATGEYLLFLNSGDWLLYNILEEVFRLDIVEDIFYGNIILENQDNLKTINRGCSKLKLTFYDFWEGTIRHQAAFIKRCLFDIYGLYDESYSIVSDWVFFIKVVIFGKATYKYKDLDISHFDTNGLGTIPSQMQKNERQRALKSFLPDSILQDYEDYNDLIQQNVKITQELNRYINRFYSADIVYSKLKKIFRVFHNMHVF